MHLVITGNAAPPRWEDQSCIVHVASVVQERDRQQLCTSTPISNFSSLEKLWRLEKNQTRNVWSRDPKSEVALRGAVRLVVWAVGRNVPVARTPKTRMRWWVQHAERNNGRERAQAASLRPRARCARRTHQPLWTPQLMTIQHERDEE